MPEVEGTPPAAAPAAPAAPPAAPPVSQDSFWQKAKESGAEAAKADHSAWLKSVYGTDDKAQIEALAKKAPGKGTDEGNEAVKKVLDELEKLKAENANLIRSGESKAMRDKVMTELMTSNQKLHDVGETLDMLMLKYDFKMLNDKLVLHHKDSGNPVFLEGSNIGTVSGLLEAWAKDSTQAWRFNASSQIATPAGQSAGTGPDAGNYNYMVKSEDLSSPGFAEALKLSGQQSMAFDGKLIDYERLKPFLSRINK